MTDAEALDRAVAQSLRCVWPQDQRFCASLDLIQEYANGILSNLSYTHFTDHSTAHSRRILMLISELLEQNRKCAMLTESERYVFCASALLHDIGMQDERSEQDSALRRESHHQISASRVKTDYQKMSVISDYADAISLVIEGHRGGIDDRFDDKVVGTCNIVRTKLLAALLYLGDELDITHERVNLDRADYIDYEPDEALHFYRHNFTQGVRVSEDRCLNISLRFPRGRTDQYSRVFRPIIVDKLRKTLEEVGPLLHPYGVYMALRDQDVKIEESDTLDPIDPELFENMVAAVRGIRNFTFLSAESLEIWRGGSNAELFYKGYVTWADIIDNLDAPREQTEEIAGAHRELFDKCCSEQALMGLLISGGGGSGKTTQLYRLAYEVVNDEYYAGVNVLWLPSDARFTFDELANLIASNQQPAIVFIDGVNINDVIDAISEQIDDPTARKYPVLLVFAARLNEWHNAGGPNVPFGTFREITLSTLSDSEIRAILSRLEDNDQLYKLTTLSPDERFAVLKSKSGGELLVAMLEATQGKRFYEIVLDEYHNIRRVYYEAAKAYELICFFFMYDVLIPEELLITFLNCVDVTDFESRVMEYTRLVIVRHPSTRFGIKYRPRHREVANILISQLSDYDTPEKKLKQVSVVLRNIDADETQQRYVVLDFFRGYIKAELKRGPSVDFENQVEDLRQFFLTNARKLTQLQERAITAGHLPELSLWSAIYKDIRLIREEIRVLRAIVRIKANDPVANYRLAKRLMRTAAVSHSPEVIAEHFFRAFAGGNRNVKFLYDYVGFCLKTRQYDYIENIIDNVRDFISYTDEEEEIKKTIGALLDGYRFTKDRSKLSNDFAEISSHIHATEKLSPADEFAYIDLIETGSTLDRLKQYEEYLTAVHPNRPKGALLRVARFASRISEERQKALRFYREYYETYIGNDPHSRDFEIMYEYARLAVELNSQPRRLTLSILRQCVQLRPLNVRCFALQARYAMKVGIKELALQAAKDGLKAAAARGRLGHPDCAMLRDILDRLEQST